MLVGKLANVRFWLGAEVQTGLPVRPLCPRERTLELKGLLCARFRLLHPGEQTIANGSNRPEAVIQVSRRERPLSDR